MTQKIVLDVDPGIVDAMVLALALFDPEVDVLAVTSVGGNVPASQTARNLQALVEYFDPPRLPRLGMGTDPDAPSPIDIRHIHGIDGLCGTPLPVAELRTQHPAEKVLCDAIRQAPGEVTLIALGPLTNLARALQRDPEIALLARQIVILGGTLAGPGNVTPAADFNFYADPLAARTVFRSPVAKTLVPLDMTNPMLMRLGDMDRLPSPETRLGALLQTMLIPAFRAYRQGYGLEGIHIHDLIAYRIALRPECAQVESMAGDVEIDGELTRGMTVFDRRHIPQWRKNLDVVTKLLEPDLLDLLVDELNTTSRRIEDGKGRQPDNFRRLQ